jgi:GR25 family glycosyltransferase involved in LPS biosynthesis
MIDNSINDNLIHNHKLLDNIWIINLDKSINRMDKITSNLKSLNLKFNRFSAVDGKKLDEKQIQLNTTFLGRTLLSNRSIIGCAMSHIELWKKLLETNKKYFLILEDDVVMTQQSIHIIKKLEKKINKKNYTNNIHNHNHNKHKYKKKYKDKDKKKYKHKDKDKKKYKDKDKDKDDDYIDWINLHCVLFGCYFNVIEFEIDDYKFGKPFFPLQTGSYIITKSGATKLLKNYEKITYHIDFEIACRNFYIGLNYYASDKPIVFLNNELETTISSKKNSIILNTLNSIGLNYFSWLLNIPVLTIKLFYEINLLILLLLIIMLINNQKINNNILFWFILLEIIINIEFN